MSLLKSKVSEDLTTEQRSAVVDLLIKYQDTWLNPRFGQVKTKACFRTHGRPVRDKLRPLSAQLREELDKQIDALLEAKVIRPSKSPWAAAPVFVSKSDGSWRMAIDYRRVNKLIKTDSYPVPILWENLQMAAGYLYYARLDGKSGFFNVPLEEICKEITAFITPRGLFEYNVLPFGIKNSLAEFQRVMDCLLGTLYGRGVLCYVDDIIIYTNDYSEFLQLLEEVLRRLLDGGVFIELKKCEFGSKEMNLLGHILSAQGIMPNPKKVVAVKDAQPPTCKAELMSFLGAAGYLRRFVPHYSEHTYALTSLLKKGVAYQWTALCQEQFEKLKDMLVEFVLLSVPKGQGPFVILCDASDRAVGSVLMQWQDGGLAILEFASRKLSETEQRWSTHEKEAYALKWSVKKFEDYLRGVKVFALTDHASLQWIDTSTVGKVQRWALYLQQFDIRVRAIKGTDNAMADWLSRSTYCKDASGDDEVDEVTIPILTGEEERQTKLRTTKLRYPMAPYLPTENQWLEAGRNIPKEDMSLCTQGKNGLWFSIRTGKLYVPPPLREALLYWFHASRYGGHFGINKTTRRMVRWVFWPNMKTDVSAYIQSCLPCTRTGAPAVRWGKDKALN
eukprot:GHVQ01024667.1.p1 GENE.GHVQ01024667.1~~GHVQ01024667.1.p1  ORF type:complete len:617 (-),score=19.13 GHVQ01024667.1:117-1967(-)